LSPELKLLDWFTPTNHAELDRTDADLNSSGATLIPGTHLVLGGGKGGMLSSAPPGRSARPEDRPKSE
jgi:hypothetical protein